MTWKSRRKGSRRGQHYLEKPRNYSPSGSNVGYFNTSSVNGADFTTREMYNRYEMSDREGKVKIKRLMVSVANRLKVRSRKDPSAKNIEQVYRKTISKMNIPQKKKIPKPTKGTSSSEPERYVVTADNPLLNDFTRVYKTRAGAEKYYKQLLEDYEIDAKLEAWFADFSKSKGGRFETVKRGKAIKTYSPPMLTGEEKRLPKDKRPHLVHYCKCGQSVRLRKKDGKWVHYGYNRIHEPYSDFLKRTDHAVNVNESRKFIPQKGWFTWNPSRGWQKENVWGEIQE